MKRVQCTYGAIGLKKLDGLVERFEWFDLYLLINQDKVGHQLQKILQYELLNATIT